MKVLVIGNGGREHALAWSLGASPRVSEVFVAPGNGGTASIAVNLSVPADDIDGLVAAAIENEIDLTVVGPEAPLASGIVDAFQKQNLIIAGPTASASRIESSKTWSKEIMRRAGVPTGKAEIYRSVENAIASLVHQSYPIVIKASGLAAGKGVIIANDETAARNAIHTLMVDRALGDAADEILIEEFLTGKEVSLIVITDGNTIYPLLPACDYKRAYDGDAGPNTGGMGAYAPVPGFDQVQVEQTIETIVRPVINQLKSEGIPYQGVLYAGLILTDDGTKVIEFNCRFGDPETEVILPLLASDLTDLLYGAATSTLSNVPEPEWHSGACVAVVLASGGYPGSYEKEKPISGIDLAMKTEGSEVFHAGTSINEKGLIVSSGGRVLAVVARGPSLRNARDMVYAEVAKISFDEAFYRHDIAVREL